ncbi:MAG: hypothetical protein WD512_19565 [Candidatus Paceibacterota bacterium]
MTRNDDINIVLPKGKDFRSIALDQMEAMLQAFGLDTTEARKEAERVNSDEPMKKLFFEES